MGISRQGKKSMKHFEATWGEGYAEPGTREIDETEVSEENGYDEEDVAKVQALEVGETADLSGPSGDLTIKRTA